jgi:2-isopropylmalate synthase
LADYRVHIVDGSDGTAATTHVLLDSKCDSETFTTEGISTNIIQASLDALIDSVELALLKRLGTTLD